MVSVVCGEGPALTLHMLELGVGFACFLYEHELEDIVWQKIWPVASIAWELWFQFPSLQKVLGVICIGVNKNGWAECK